MSIKTKPKPKASNKDWENGERRKRGSEKEDKGKKGGETYGTGIGLLLLPHRHLPVVKQAADRVVERQELVVERLPKDVGVVLQPHALFAHRLVGGAAVVPDLCAELGAGGLEEVGFLFLSVEKRWNFMFFKFCDFFLSFLLFCWSRGFGVKGGICVLCLGYRLMISLLLSSVLGMGWE